MVKLMTLHMHTYVKNMEKKMKAAGADIKVSTRAGWGHGFEANYSAEFEADAEAWHECSRLLYRR